jgi:REP element-mobilizing transposase RayT
MAINVRTNHVHAVISIGAKNSKPALIALKANASRDERRWAVEWQLDPWAEKGSRRKLWNERSVFEACDYVLNRQGKISLITIGGNEFALQSSNYC